MQLNKLAKKLEIDFDRSLSGLDLYNNMRQTYINKFLQTYPGQFQSPTILPSTNTQRSKAQVVSEHSVYQRSDYEPVSMEDDFNKLYKKIGSVKPKTLAFNSGMGAISSLAYFLFNHKGVNKLGLSKNVYFETGWIMDHYKKYSSIDEYDLKFPKSCEAYWIEFPINCTRPDKFPFEKQMDLLKFFNLFLNQVQKTKRQVYLVIDYTLFYLPFDIESYITKFPKNLSVFLVSSLQKHRGYGLDLTNGGVITFYSNDTENDYSELSKIRAITGTSITQETVWLMPKINNKIINQLVKDSGTEAKRVFKECSDSKPNVTLYYSDNDKFLTDFIFIQIGKSVMKKSKKRPYLGERLIEEIVIAAKKNGSYILNGTSFGFPFTRIFKNSERYANADTLRIAVGHDSDFNKYLGKSISEGIENFVQKYC